MNRLKSLLGLRIDLDDRTDDELDDDTNLYRTDDYNFIVSAPKYTDSNSNTKDLEKLLSHISIGEPKQINDTYEQDPKLLAQKVSIENIICHDCDELLPGQPVYAPAKFGKPGGKKFVLGKYDIPKHVKRAVDNGDTSSLELNTQMDTRNYVSYFQTLLWVEEAQQVLEMRRYDMYDVIIGKHQGFFMLEVPGLAEGRPSLMRGDRLILRSDQRSSYYEGYIHDVRENDILFKVHSNIHSSATDGLKFDVQFLSTRTPFRRCHHGVCQYMNSPSFHKLIFPVYSEGESVSPVPMINVKTDDPSKLPCFNESLNIYQRRAVLNILRATSRPTPYILFGPPGTGKTITLVECILQIYRRTRDFKILVCANSNACADLSARRIQESGVVPKKDIIRLSAFYRMDKLIPPDLEEISKDMDMIDTDTYRQCRVIVTTCIQSGTLYQFHDRFDYVFIDEAGHASEPETLIPMGLLSHGGCSVLAGDPHQLGPVCISKLADQYGLGTSLLERLCRRSIYQRNTLREDNKLDYNERYLSKLRVCYRCDARVMSISNKMFYDNDLKFVNETPEKWLNIMKFEHPLAFHNCHGRDKRESTNPSFFNAAECIMCLSYARRLYESGLHPDQLGIITPYRRQIDKLNLLFESCKLEKCKIGTMEEFQGDEREIIIISTVRTRKKRLAFDNKFKLGFLFNPKRFNVAISRAKWMVIVIGDPQILKVDTCWQQYIEHAYSVGKR